MQPPTLSATFDARGALDRIGHHVVAGHDGGATSSRLRVRTAVHSWDVTPRTCFSTWRAPSALGVPLSGRRLCRGANRRPSRRGVILLAVDTVGQA
jgi:hypothetical protein